MDTTIEFNQIDYLPNNSLVILKDDLSKKDFFCLILKDTLDKLINCKFKTCFINVDGIPICVLMIKTKNKLYKCLISLEIPKEFDFLKGIFNLKSFNLYLFSDSKKIDIIKIRNSNYKKLYEAISEVKKVTSEHSYEDLLNAKQIILNNYSDYDLWNM